MLRIAIISPKLSLIAINEVINDINYDTEFIVYTYDNLEEINNIYQECKDNIDGLFFSGELGHFYAMQNIKNLDVPCKFITYDTKYILAVFLNFIMDNPDIPLNRIYVDFLGPFNDYYGIKGLIKEEYMPKCNDENSFIYEDMLNQGLELLKKGEIDIMLTRSTNNLNNIEESGIPFKHIAPDKKVVADSIDHALMEIKASIHEVSSKVICIINLIYKEEPSINEQEYFEISLYKALVDIKKDLNKNINISLQTNKFELLFYDAEEVSELKSTRYIIDYLKKLNLIDFNLGVGISSSFDDSRHLAENALRISTSYGINDGFAAYETGYIAGPLSQEETLIYSTNNHKIDDFARINGIDLGNMSRILGLYHKDKDNYFNSDILSKWLNITERSCNRIIVQLLQHNLITEIDIKNQKKGRPRKFYKFNKKNMDAF